MSEGCVGYAAGAQSIGCRGLWRMEGRGMATISVLGNGDSKRGFVL